MNSWVAEWGLWEATAGAEVVGRSNKSRKNIESESDDDDFIKFAIWSRKMARKDWLSKRYWGRTKPSKSKFVS